MRDKLTRNPIETFILTPFLPHKRKGTCSCICHSNPDNIKHVMACCSGYPDFITRMDKLLEDSPATKIKKARQAREFSKQIRE